MAAALTVSQPATHVRSTSLPLDAHPLISSVEDQLQRLKSSEASSSTNPSQKLDGLKNLYERVNDMLQIPQISCETNSEIVEGSLRILEICSSTRDVFSQMKECLRDLESSLRRRRGGDYSALMSEVESYVISRERLNKSTWKFIRNLKKLEKNETPPDTKGSTDSILREIEIFSFTVFESLLTFIAQPESRSRLNFFVLKPLRARRVLPKEAILNEVESLDVELLALRDRKSGKDISTIQFQSILKRLESVELSIQEIEEGLEYLYRHLVKTRVSLLNGFSQ